MKNKYLKWIASALLGLGTAQAGPAPYFITDIGVYELPTLGGNQTLALDINDAGEIVGSSQTVNGITHAFLYRQGLMEDITFGAGFTAAATGINNHSQVVGWILGAESEHSHGFYYDNGSTTFLDELDQSGCYAGGSATAINDAGLIAGGHVQYCALPAGQAARWDFYASPWKGLMPANLATLAGTGANNLNHAGVIVGEDTQGLVTFTGGWYWKAGNLREIPKTVGTPPEWYYTNTQKPYGINSSAEIVGEAGMLLHGLPQQPGDLVQRGYFWDGVSSDSQGLPILGDGKNAGAREINDQDFIVGWADRWIADANAYKMRAVVWYRGKITQLPLPAGIGDIFGRVPTVCWAGAVNNMSRAGIVEVVGYCSFAGKTKGMLWTLKTAQIAVQPHP